jgi:hypothetical protein
VKDRPGEGSRFLVSSDWQTRAELLYALAAKASEKLKE